MSIQKIPNSQKQIIQSNEGDYRGNLWSTFNIDLDSNLGVIKTSKRLDRYIGADTVSSEDIQALQIHDGNYYLATTSDVYRCNVNNDPRIELNWPSVSTLGAEDLGFETDMTSFNGLLLISLGTDIMSWDGSTKNDDWWTTVAGGSALTVNKTHTLEVLRSGKDTLFITDGNRISYYNDDAAITIITVDSLLTTHCMTPSLDRMWVGAYTEVGNSGYVFEVQVGGTNIDGDPAYNQSYEVEGRVPLTMFTYRNTPFVITEQGYIQAFNGAGFQTVAQFPWADKSDLMAGAIAGQVQDTAISRAIHPKGAKVKGKYCYIYVNTESGTNGEKIDPRSPSGVWVLNLETYSLTHRYALNNESTDLGVHTVQRSGPVIITNVPNTRIMVGGEIGSQTGVWMESDTANQAYFTTVRHESNTLADSFEILAIKADTLGTDDSVEVKYKPVTRNNFPLTVTDITWLNETQFTTTSDLTGVEIGDEIEIILGHRSGNLANITNINGEITKTVTIDESYGVLNETSDIQIERWKKVPIEYVVDEGEYKKFGIGVTAPAMEYKVVLNGEVTVREIISKSNSKVEL